ncbi:MAG: hypothetical protein ACRDJH_05375 [Thermomicrobiales bacterium]
MFAQRLKFTIVFGMLALVALVSIAAPAGSTAQTTPAGEGALPIEVAQVDGTLIQDGILKFDVAEDMSRFVFNAAPVHEDGMPAFGNPFITQGYIYPYGTLDGSNGVLADGSPEFPDKVLGQWTCRGWFVGDGAHTTSGPMVITTQLYSFGEEFGESTLVTEGYELADVEVAIARAVTGGTGEYSGARGEAQQTFLGFNATEGVSLRFEIAVQ